MIRRKLFAAPVLLLLLMLLVAGVAAGASILTSANQIAQVVSPASNNGSFTISSMQVVSSNGTLQPIPGPIPENYVLIVTKVTGYFIAADPGLSGGTTFNLGDYYRSSPQLTNGFGSINESITPGVPITGLGANVYLHLATDQSKTPLTGKLNLRVMGYIANIN